MLRVVEITPVLNGWIIKVGCQTVAFNDLNHMLEEIQAYLEDPDETEKRYRESAVNAKHLKGDCIEPVTCEEDEAEPAAIPRLYFR